MKRLAMVLGGLLVLGSVGAGIVYSVKWAYGSYGDYYYVTAEFERAGQQMLPESDVRVKGVEVGEVSKIELVDLKAHVTLKLEAEYADLIPTGAEAFVALKTPLGAKYIELRFPPGASGPYLSDGDRIPLAQTHVGPELEDLLDDGVHVLEAIDPDDIATVIGELSRAADGHGDDIARSLQVNNDLSLIFAQTLKPQIEGIDDWVTIFEALEEKGVDLNFLAQAVNEGAPVYASESAQRDLDRALVALVPFSADLADLLIYNRADWDRMMDSGDVVLETIADRPEGLRDLVHGLYIYVHKLGQEIPPAFMLNDGSAGAGFVNFIGGNDQEEEENQVCTAFPPEVRDQIPVCQDRAR